ncbi:Stk1 family PASTA domain-containing Ser/Thr kinase [Pseudoclavibacter alba]|uniref:non-specific serine/threonine protein kinase n=2 Tax=Pseudoclavibacter albus TaxID=272241 RepID=A0ABT2HUV1_9MICO|nr:Stk1 family PASTA domain-containing Ser/Thr kinase [Pseudoclavibacter alba]
MAEVYLGQDTRLGRQIAVKLLNTQLAGEPSFRQRFRAEAQAAARMTHPTIVRVFDAGEDTFLRPDGHELIVPYIVMEYVPGQQLRDIIAEGPLPADKVEKYMSGLLTALEYSHRAGVVHRDIKPGNVMVTPDDEIKVMDFGIARAISDTAGTIAQTTAILGTASYFSPEQARGEQVDGRSDLYSAGIVLYEMLTGRVPFQGDSAVAVAYQHVTEMPVKPSEINPNVSPAMDAVVMKALAKNRDDRFQSASEFRRVLEDAARGIVPAFADELERDADKTELFGAAPSSVSATEAALNTLVEEDDRGPQTRRRPPAMWLWGIGLLLVAVVAAITIWVITLPNSRNELIEAGVQVPDVTGQTWEEAEATLTGLGLVPQRESVTSETAPPNTVTETKPGAGLNVPRNQVITVLVSTGPKAVVMPTLVGMTEQRAKETLEANGLKLGSVRSEDSPTVPEGTVISSDPEGESEIAPGSSVNLVVSTGKVTLPDLKGVPLDDATAQLQQLGLIAIATEDATCPAAEGSPVSSQSVAPGAVAQRSQVTLNYCTKPAETATPNPAPSAPATAAPTATP